MNGTRAITVVIPSHRDWQGAMETARAMARQALPHGTTARIVIAAQEWPRDAGEADDADVLVIRLPGAVGRAAARNAGAARATGGLLVFVDSDCRPATAAWLSSLASAFDDGDVVAAGGPVIGAVSGFWARYQSDVDALRAGRSTRGVPQLSSANLAVRREAFEACGGFDEGYRGYGFEDRDLVLRLSALGTVIRAPDAAMRHEAPLALAGIAAKLHEAGGAPSLRFSRSHPAAYRASGYARMDARLHPWLRLPARVVGPASLRLARPLGWLVQREWLPYVLGKALVKATSAAAFLYGTVRTPPASHSA